jgi:hypothetical protein
MHKKGGSRNRGAALEIGKMNGSVFAGLEADLAFDDFAEGNVFGGELFEGLDERTVAATELFHAAGNHVNQKIGIRNNFQSVANIVVSHGERWRRMKKVED